MYVKLTIAERLKDLRTERRLTLEQLAEQTGLSRAALGRYESDDCKEISPTAVVTLAKFYGVSADYLLGLTETKNHSNTDLHDLHLSDDMIELLANGRINNRLLCEIAAHKDFRRLMTDIEICVDRIADSRINDLNTMLSAVRQKILDDQEVDQDDLYVRTLELAQISTESYFSHVIQHDLDAILHDIREAHRRDSTTADSDSPAADAAKRLQEAMRYEGSREEKMVRVFLANLGSPYDRLTKEEFEYIKIHPQKGCDIVNTILSGLDDDSLLKVAENIALYHHEKYDGSGYPKGLKGEEIPFEAKIMAIADVYDALVSKRCYKQPMTHEKACKVIKDSMGTHFDPLLEDCFDKASSEIHRYYTQD